MSWTIVWKLIEPKCDAIDKNKKCSAQQHHVEKNWMCRNGNRNGNARHVKHLCSRIIHCGYKNIRTEHRIQEKRKRWQSYGYAHTNSSTKKNRQKQQEKYILNVKFILAWIHYFECQMRIFRWITNRKRYTHAQPMGKMKRLKDKAENMKLRLCYHFNNEFGAHEIFERLWVNMAFVPGSFGAHTFAISIELKYV